MKYIQGGNLKIELITMLETKPPIKSVKPPGFGPIVEKDLQEDILTEWLSYCLVLAQRARR